MRPWTGAYAIGNPPGPHGGSPAWRAASALLAALLFLTVLAAYTGPTNGRGDAAPTLLAALDTDEVSERSVGKGKPDAHATGGDVGLLPQAFETSREASRSERAVSPAQPAPHDNAAPPQLLQRPPPGR